MHSFTVIYQKRSTWTYHRDIAARGRLLNLKVNLYANYINPFMACGKPLGNGILNFLMQLSVLNLFNPKLITHSLQKGSGTSFIALLVYVDDIVITTPSLNAIAEVKSLSYNTFKLKDLGTLKYFLGLDMSNLRESVTKTTSMG